MTAPLRRGQPGWRAIIRVPLPESSAKPSPVAMVTAIGAFRLGLQLNGGGGGGGVDSLSNNRSPPNINESSLFFLGDV